MLHRPHRCGWAVAVNCRFKIAPMLDGGTAWVRSSYHAVAEDHPIGRSRHGTVLRQTQALVCGRGLTVTHASRGTQLSIFDICPFAGWSKGSLLTRLAARFASLCPALSRPPSGTRLSAPRD